MSKRTTFAGLPRLLAAVLLAAACTDPVGPARHGPGALAAATGAAATGIALDQKNGTLGEYGRMLIKGFNSTNPHNGDAILATFVWRGSNSTNIIDSVTDVLTTTPYSRVGNTYTLVAYRNAGGLSMATYVATNVRNFPDGYNNPAGDSILAVRAGCCSPRGLA
jgi:hypothetical protein